jgi:hypothetical protein
MLSKAQRAAESFISPRRARSNAAVTSRGKSEEVRRINFTKLDCQVFIFDLIYASATKPPRRKVGMDNILNSNY